MASINSIMSGGTKKLLGAGYNVKMIHYTKLIPSKKQNREERRIEELADMLELSGEIKQPLLVRKSQGDTYEVIAGHRRRLAAIYNVEEKGLKQFEFLPCKIETYDDTAMEIDLITTNISVDSLSDIEKVNAVMRLKELLPRQEGVDLKGRELRKRIAENMNMSPTKIGQLEHIGNKLGISGKEALAREEISVSTADALASLPEEKQEELLEQPELKLQDVKDAVTELKFSTRNKQEFQSTKGKGRGACLKDVQGIREERKMASEEKDSVYIGFDIEDIEEYLEEATEKMREYKSETFVSVTEKIRKQQMMLVEGLTLLLKKSKNENEETL